MHSLRNVLLLILTINGFAVPAAAQPILAPIPGPAPGVIFVVNGSGGGYQLTNGLWKAIERSGHKFWVETLPWSRFQSPPHDHADHVGQLAAAQQLAARIQTVRQHQPGRPIYVVAFSSGNRVALEAAKTLPPGSINRMILLAPSVAYFWDLTPALQASCDGIDCFYSREDNVLEWAGSVISTADGYRAPCAGQIGFWLPSREVPSYFLYEQKLRQYPWGPHLRWTGHTGHHYGWTLPEFLQASVVPLLVQSEMRAK